MLILCLTQESTTVSVTIVVHSLKVLALSDAKLSLDAVIDLLKCFPNLEKLYIEVIPCTRVCFLRFLCL